MIVGELDAVYIIYFIFKKNTKPVVMTLQTPRATIQPVHIVRSNLPVNLLVYTNLRTTIVVSHQSDGHGKLFTLC